MPKMKTKSGAAKRFKVTGTGKIISFMTLVPLYPEEMDLKLKKGAEALLDHLGRHLARTETLDACATGDFAQAADDVALQTLFRQREAQAAFQVAGGFDRSLHVDSCHRWPTPPAR